MSVVEFLSQPICRRFALTLLHFLWQGLAVAFLAVAVVRAFRIKHGNGRYAAYLLAFAAMVVCPVVTFTMIDISAVSQFDAVIEAAPAENIAIPSYTALPPTEAATPVEVSPETEISSETEISPETVISTPVTFTPQPVKEESVPLADRFSTMLDISMPWVPVIWMLGVIVLSVRLLAGFIGIHRWRRDLKPLPDGLSARVDSLSDRLGMRGFSRVFISPKAMQAMAVGYLKPIVLLPAAMITQMSPDMLEAVIAHELAHIRRFDLWVNLAQRLTETFLFYHPAVWWLSNRLRSERELCCDAMAVKLTGERLTYAKTLQKVTTDRVNKKKPFLAAGLGQNTKPTLSRVRHILGLKPHCQNTPAWQAGLIAVLLLAAIAIPATLGLTNQTSEKPDTKEEAKGPEDFSVEYNALWDLDAAKIGVPALVDAYDKFIEKYHHDQRIIDVIYNLGAIYESHWDGQDNDKALEYYLLAARIAEVNSISWKNMNFLAFDRLLKRDASKAEGILLGMKRHLKKDDYELAMKLDKSYIDLYAEQGKVDKAEKIYDEILALCIDPTMTEKSGLHKSTIISNLRNASASIAGCIKNADELSLQTRLARLNTIRNKYPQVRQVYGYNIAVKEIKSRIKGINPGKPENTDKTLRDVLNDKSIDFKDSGISLLDEVVIGYHVLNKPEVFCIAFYLKSNVSHQLGRVYVKTLDKKQNIWRQGEIYFTTIKAVRYFIPNQIERIDYVNDYIYLGIHSNPSAGYTFVLTKDLKFQTALFGNAKEIFDDDTLVYRNGQVHFAPTHSAEMSIYNPHNKTDRKIYPSKPYSKVRAEHIRKVKAAYEERSEEWFMQHNHHGDPERFNNHLKGEVTIDNEKRSLSFVIAYDNKDCWPEADLLKQRYFNRLHRSLKKYPVGKSPHEMVFSSLASAIGITKRVLPEYAENTRETILSMFDDDPELREMFQVAFSNQTPKGKNPRKHFISLDKKWATPETWKKIIKIITVPSQEYTEVLHVYENIDAKEIKVSETIKSPGTNETKVSDLSKNLSEKNNGSGKVKGKGVQSDYNWPRYRPKYPPSDKTFFDMSPQQLIPYVLGEKVIDRDNDDYNGRDGQRLACAWFVWKTRGQSEIREKLADAILLKLFCVKSQHDNHHLAQFLGPLEMPDHLTALIKTTGLVCCYGGSLIDGLVECGTTDYAPVLINILGTLNESVRGVVNPALEKLTGEKVVHDKKLLLNIKKQKELWTKWWEKTYPGKKLGPPSDEYLKLLADERIQALRRFRKVLGAVHKYRAARDKENPKKEGPPQVPQKLSELIGIENYRGEKITKEHLRAIYLNPPPKEDDYDLWNHSLIIDTSLVYKHNLFAVAYIEGRIDLLKPEEFVLLDIPESLMPSYIYPEVAKETIKYVWVDGNKKQVDWKLRVITDKDPHQTFSPKWLLHKNDQTKEVLIPLITTAMMHVDEIKASPDGRYLAVRSQGEGHTFLQVIDLTVLLQNKKYKVLQSIDPYHGWVHIDRWDDKKLIFKSDALMTHRNKEGRVHHSLFMSSQTYSLTIKTGNIEPLSDEAKDPVAYFVKQLSFKGSRENAVTALEYLKAKSAIGELKKALTKETHKAVKTEIQRVIDELKKIKGFVSFFPDMATLPQNELNPLLEKLDKAIESDKLEDKARAILMVANDVPENMRFHGSYVLRYDNPEIKDRLISLYLRECAKANLPTSDVSHETNPWLVEEPVYILDLMAMVQSTFDPRIYEIEKKGQSGLSGDMRLLYLATVNPEETLNYLHESKRGYRAGKQKGHQDYFYHGEDTWMMSVDRAYTLLSFMSIQSPNVLIKNRDRVLTFVRTHLKHFVAPRKYSYKLKPVYLKWHDYRVRNTALDVLQLLGTSLEDMKMIAGISKDAPVVDLEIGNRYQKYKEQIHQKAQRVSTIIKNKIKALDTLNSLSGKPAETLGLVARSFGYKEAAFSKKLSSLNSRILFVDGSGLRSVLSDRDIPKKVRYDLVDLLGRVVESGIYSKFGKTSKQPTLPKETAAKLKAISGKIEKEMAGLPEKTEDDYESSVRKVLGMYLNKADILADAGCTIDASLSYSEAFEMEVQKFGPAMGERSITPLAAGNYHLGVLEKEKDLNKLLELLYSERISLKEKRNFLFNLKDMIRLDAFNETTHGKIKGSVTLDSLVSAYSKCNAESLRHWTAEFKTPEERGASRKEFKSVVVSADAEIKNTIVKLLQETGGFDAVLSRSKDIVNWRQFPKDVSTEKGRKFEYSISRDDKRLRINYMSWPGTDGKTFYLLQNSFWNKKHDRIVPSIYVLIVDNGNVKMSEIIEGSNFDLFGRVKHCPVAPVKWSNGQTGVFVLGTGDGSIYSGLNNKCMLYSYNEQLNKWGDKTTIPGLIGEFWYKQDTGQLRCSPLRISGRAPLPDIVFQVSDLASPLKMEISKFKDARYDSDNAPINVVFKNVSSKAIEAGSYQYGSRKGYIGTFCIRLKTKDGMPVLKAPQLAPQKGLVEKPFKIEPGKETSFTIDIADLYDVNKLKPDQYRLHISFVSHNAFTGKYFSGMLKSNVIDLEIKASDTLNTSLIEKRNKLLADAQTESICKLFKKAYDSLNDGGTVNVMDMMTDHTHTQPKFSALFAVNMALTTDNGWVFSDSQVKDWLSQAGFTDMKVTPLPPPMPHWMVTARK
ncbi:MAG: M48 family metalloprotease [Planctomycetes bacterium]|nr:M48 family metalloprotease [Planctomycetota bacterium]